MAHQFRPAVEEPGTLDELSDGLRWHGRLSWRWVVGLGVSRHGGVPLLGLLPEITSSGDGSCGEAGDVAGALVVLRWQLLRQR